MNDPAPSPEVLRTLVSNHDRFLKFLQPRLGTRGAAEDVLQSAFVKAVERGDEIRYEESAVAWFYRLLRNTVVDHHRRRAIDARAMTSIAQEPPAADPELENAVCQCVKDIIPTLKGEYARILQQVEMEGAAIADVAKAENVTPNNAMVRLHRARKALHGRLVDACGTCTEHGCLDCRCKA